MEPDLALAFALADLADAETAPRWSVDGVDATTKSDGTLVTEADRAAEMAILDALRTRRPDDGMLGEEIGAVAGTSSRRWIVDGIDGTMFYAAGATTWGTLIALENGGEVVVAVCSSPTQDRRWWAARNAGAFTGPCDRSVATRLAVSRNAEPTSSRIAILPSPSRLTPPQQTTIERISGGTVGDHPWSHQMSVAEGRLDLAVWFGGDIWDHAAPSLIVEEAGGRFSDHYGGRRLDTRTAIYSNGVSHDAVLAATRTRP